MMMMMMMSLLFSSVRISWSFLAVRRLVSNGRLTRIFVKTNNKLIFRRLGVSCQRTTFVYAAGGWGHMSYNRIESIDMALVSCFHNFGLNWRRGNSSQNSFERLRSYFVASYTVSHRRHHDIRPTWVVSVRNNTDVESLQQPWLQRLPSRNGGLCSTSLVLKTISLMSGFINWHV